MDTHKFFVEKLRFHLNEPDMLVLVGWFYDGKAAGREVMAYLDGEKLPVTLTVNKGAEVRQKYLGTINEINEEVVGIVTLPKDWRERKKFEIFTDDGEKKKRAYAVSTKKLRVRESRLEYYIENCHRDEDTVTVTGWCMGAGEVNLYLLDQRRQKLQVKTDHYFRKDLLSVFPECDTQAKPGFMIQASVKRQVDDKNFFLEMRNAEHYSRTRLRKWDDGGRWQYVLEKSQDAFRYLERNGLAATIHKIETKLAGRSETSYDAWCKKYDAGKEELDEQRKHVFSYQPLFSIVVPLYRTKPEYLQEMIESVQAQTYGNWQLCLADGSLSGNDEDRQKDSFVTELTPVLEKYAKADARITFTTLQKNLGISGNTNAALAMAAGDYIVLADHDDIVPANALYELADALNQDQSIDVLYSDEDKISMDGKKRFEPHFKPDFDLDLLCSVNYICHLFAAKKELVDMTGGFCSEYDGAQDLDFILKCCENAKNIRHIPKILYHWRCHMQSTAANPESKLYAFEAGRRAIEAHYDRMEIPATVENAAFYGMYRTKYNWKEKPLVSVIIPNKDHKKDLEKCMNSILGKNTYPNIEFIIVENNSTEQETFDYYKELEVMHENVHVVFYEGDFNYSKINNFGADAAKGSYLLLLNNDTEMIDGGAVNEMLGYCMREDVGIVGAKLLYEDETIQHAGVVLGFGGTAGHAFIGKPRYDTGYFGRILCAQDYSAVTAACMMIKRSVFDEVGGLTEELAVAFNDVDFCLKVRKAGKLVVYDPYAEWFHYESKSRGYEDSPEKVERFNDEVDILLRSWREIIEQGDPYYNPNLTLDNSDFSLRR